MTKPSNDDFQTDFALQQMSAGRYNKLHEAGMATRFVKGTSGNPNGRPKKRPSALTITEQR